jgi:transitional endoplasmic reticulum ATPase
MPALDFELRNFERQKERGLAALRAGRRAEAQSALLRAAECLFRIAAKSAEPFRSRRSRNARELLDLARGVGEGAMARAAGGTEDEAAPFEMVERPEVTFDSVAGLPEVKEEIRLRMVYPFTHPRIASRYGLRGGGGLLFYGPPGTGKTLLARAVAGEIDAAFFTVSPADIMSKWVGEAERNVAALFAAARGRERAVIFIDEIEALAPARTGDASSVMTRVVPQLLSELEGVSGRGAGALLFIGATNAPWDLDPAILRPGRFDVKVYVGLPDAEARAGILALTLSGRPIEPSFDFDAAAEVLEGYSGADLRRLVEKTVGDCFLAEMRGKEAGCISVDDLLAATSAVRPSVDAAGLARYREWPGR